MICENGSSSEPWGGLWSSIPKWCDDDTTILCFVISWAIVWRSLLVGSGGLSAKVKIFSCFKIWKGGLFVWRTKCASMEEKKKEKIQILNLTTNLQCVTRLSWNCASELTFVSNNLKPTKKNLSCTPIFQENTAKCF